MKNILQQVRVTVLLICGALVVGPSVCHADDPNGLFFKPIPAKVVVLTFDDACLSHVTNVAPLLKAHGFGGTFYISELDSFTTRKDWYMTWAQIKSLDDLGLEVGEPPRTMCSLARAAWGLAGVNCWDWKAIS